MGNAEAPSLTLQRSIIVALLITIKSAAWAMLI
jgi:hypothetical protein